MLRIPGISIEGFAAANDPDHFGVEGRGAVVRGIGGTVSLHTRLPFDSNNRDRVPTNASWGGPNVPQFGNTYQTTTRAKEQRNIVDDYALNFKFRPSDSWSHEIDLQYIDAETTDDDFTLYLGTQANASLDLRDEIPVIGIQVSLHR